VTAPEPVTPAQMIDAQKGLGISMRTWGVFSDEERAAVTRRWLAS